MPSKKDSRVDIRVNVPSFDIGQKMFKNTEDFESLTHGYFLSVTLCVKEVFVIPKRVARLRKWELENYHKNIRFLDADDDTIISVLNTFFSRHCHSSFLSLLSNDENFLRLVQGIKVVLERFSSSLYMNDHFESIKKIEDINRVVIVKEKNASCLTFTIFGESLLMQKAKEGLISYFDELKGKTLTLTFDGRNGHKGVLPTLIKKYGTNLMRLSFRNGIHNIVICLENKIIQITGQNDVISELDEELNQLFAVSCIEELYFHDACIICEVSPSAKNNCRLQLCGHNVCHGCLQILVTSSYIPIKCPIKECDTALSVIDIESAISSSESVKKIFYEKCQKNYFLSSGVKSCPTDRCDTIFQVPENKEDTIRCETCYSIICTECWVFKYLCECVAF